MIGPHTEETKDRISATKKAKWQDPVWCEKEMNRRQLEKENGTYAKRGQSISKTLREKNKGKSCVCKKDGYRRLLGYGNSGILEHVKVMEDYLERPLEPDEMAHHCDRVKLHNDIENLELCLRSKHIPDYHPEVYGRKNGKKKYEIIDGRFVQNWE